MADQTVLYERNGDIALITLNRPERLNAITFSMLVDLLDCFDTAKEDHLVKAVILTGAGRAFCAGEDLKETAAGKSLDDWIREMDRLQEVQRRVMGLGKPLIAAVRGYAVGGGCEFAMSCDIRIAAKDTKFGFPETELGMTLTTAGTKLLGHLVGPGKAKELVFTGDFINADEAVRIGLVNTVVSNERLMEEAMGLAKRIVRRSPLALRLSRNAIDQGLHSSFEQILELEASHLLACVGAQGYRGLVEKKLEEMKAH